MPEHLLSPKSHQHFQPVFVRIPMCWIQPKCPFKIQYGCIKVCHPCTCGASSNICICTVLIDSQCFVETLCGKCYRQRARKSGDGPELTCIASKHLFSRVNSAPRTTWVIANLAVCCLRIWSVVVPKCSCLEHNDRSPVCWVLIWTPSWRAKFGLSLRRFNCRQSSYVVELKSLKYA